MTAGQLQEGADWLYAQFYRIDRILVRFLRTLGTCGWVPALLGLKLNLTYRYDNRRERIRGSNPMQRGDTHRLVFREPLVTLRNAPMDAGNPPD
jgi:hypothetical protein